MHWCCVWTRRVRFRRWTGHSRCCPCSRASWSAEHTRSEEHTSELQSHSDLVCRLLLEKKKLIQILRCEVRPRRPRRESLDVADASTSHLSFHRGRNPADTHRMLGQKSRFAHRGLVDAE